MEEPSPTNPLICLGCGADNPADAVWCRVCRSPLHGRQDAPRAAGKWVRPRVGFAEGWSFATIMVAIALLALTIGLARPAPGLSILLLLTGPAFLITYTRAQAKRRRGVPMTGTEKVGWFVFSVAMTIVTLIALGVVTLLALTILVWAVCFSP